MSSKVLKETLRKALGVWVIAEAIFFVYYKVKYYQIQKFIKLPVLDPERRRALAAKIYTELGKTTRSGTPEQGAKEWIMGWFGGAHIEAIQRSSLEEMLASTFFNKICRHLNQEERTELEKYVEDVEKLLGHRFTPGRVERDVSKNYLYNYKYQVRAWYRPFLFYVLIYFIKYSIYAYLKYRKLSFEMIGHIKYWHHKPESLEKKSVPIVFFHGIGPGLLPYIKFLKRLFGKREIFIIQLPWVGMEPFSDLPDHDDFCDTVDVMLASHFHDKALFVGHSYGTFVCRWMHKRHPRLFSGLVLIDPVSILIFAPYVTANFIFQTYLKDRISSGAITSRIQRLLLRISLFLTVREMGIASTVTRFVVWYDDNFFADDLPPNTSIVLGSKDDILPAPKIKRYLDRYNSTASADRQVLVEYCQDATHGGSLLISRFLDRVVDIVLQASVTV
jgi:pimeloyl-ACP methyl ester carboxylesterase